MEFSLTTLDNGIRLAKVSGKMDIQGINQVGEKFALQIGSSGESTIVDLSGVNFIASLGMRTLISTARSIAHKGGKMVLLSPQSLVKEALHTAGFDSLVPMYTSLDDAVAALTIVENKVD
jgi:anti-sigma B factor antagonist